MVKIAKILVLLVILILFTFSCENIFKSDEKEKRVTDIDGNKYKIVKIGDQWWMAENLKVTHYRNGEPILDCWVYNNNDSLADTYGRLYSWHAVGDSRNIAPNGWHIPTDEEWKKFEMYLGMSESDANIEGWRGTDEGKKLKSTSGWISDGNGTDDYDFTILAAGFRYTYGNFDFIGHYTNFWSATESDMYNAWFRHLDYNYVKLNRNYINKGYGFSIRCVQD